MRGLECQILLFLILVGTGFGSLPNEFRNSSFAFHRQPTFARITFNVPLNFSAVYGKLEPIGSEWFVLFELDHSLFPSTYPTINEDIQSDDLASQCRRFEAVREVEIEIELYSTFVRLRCGNSEKYAFPESIRVGREFATNFFVQEQKEEPLCLVGVRVEQLEISRFTLPPPTTSQPLIVEPIIIERIENGQKTPSRRMLPNTVNTVTQSSRLWTGKVRFATYKMQNRNKPTEKPVNGHSYIDIQKDRETYQEVQRSKTKEINSVWSTTFIVFLTIEIIVIGSFITFGLTMFVLLQIRPKTSKHIEIVF